MGKYGVPARFGNVSSDFCLRKKNQVWLDFNPDNEDVCTQFIFTLQIWERKSSWCLIHCQNRYAASGDLRKRDKLWIAQVDEYIATR